METDRARQLDFIELCLAKASWARCNGWTLMENAYLATAADLHYVALRGKQGTDGL